MKLEDTFVTDKNIYRAKDVHSTICGYVNVPKEQRGKELVFTVIDIYSNDVTYLLESPENYNYYLSHVYLESNMLNFQTLCLGDKIVVYIEESGNNLKILGMERGFLPKEFPLTLQVLNQESNAVANTSSPQTFYVDRVDGDFCYIATNSSYYGQKYFKVKAPRQIFTSGSTVTVVKNIIKRTPTDHNGVQILTLDFKLRTF